MRNVFTTKGHYERDCEIHFNVCWNGLSNSVKEKKEVSRRVEDYMGMSK